MPDIKTDESLLDALREASRRQLSEDELHAQRVSFIMGSLGSDNNVTRARVEEILAEQEGKKRAS